ncbi:MAG: TatD family hydrolase [Francisellaceae bacterium]|jgi:TatD DNase family protein|nr:TatD family hydrolase [Francisellaceae bacterium]MBT6206442.1 TatD family hydrolase [Francisellaceae bacterium]MBT6537971.1 TatD family hydrolase [Francisellaceae bacterium]
MLVDSHCHLHMIDYAKLGKSFEQVMDECSDLEKLLCVSTTPQDFQKMFDFTQAYSHKISLSAGLHPSEVAPEGWQDLISKSLDSSRVVAVGETGLDFHYDSVDKVEQKERFAWQINKSKEVNLPLIIHTREAKEDTIDIMIDSGRYDVTGVMHCFTEDLDMAKKCLDLGFYISISGIVTFKNADQIRQVAKNIPLDMLLVETDSPYLSPAPNRGKTNIPAYVNHTAQFVADLRGIHLDELAEQTTHNFYNLFRKCK